MFNKIQYICIILSNNLVVNLSLHSSHFLARNEAEVRRRRGSPGPRKPAGWRRRRRTGLALPLQPVRVRRQLPLQVPPQLERRTWRTRGAGSRRGDIWEEQRRSLPQNLCFGLDTVLSVTWTFLFFNARRAQRRLELYSEKRCGH